MGWLASISPMLQIGKLRCSVFPFYFSTSFCKASDTLEEFAASYLPKATTRAGGLGAIIKLDFQFAVSCSFLHVPHSLFLDSKEIVLLQQWHEINKQIRPRATNPCSDRSALSRTPSHLSGYSAPSTTGFINSTRKRVYLFNGFWIGIQRHLGNLVRKRIHVSQLACCSASTELWWDWDVWNLNRIPESFPQCHSIQHSDHWK